jgi:hypothetical protein
MITVIPSLLFLNPEQYPHQNLEAHTSGTARIAEVLETLSIDDEQIIVNVQGDEPMLDEQAIKQVANNLANSKMQMAPTFYTILSTHNNWIILGETKIFFSKGIMVRKCVRFNQDTKLR